jgi:hypothetical protein
VIVEHTKETLLLAGWRNEWVEWRRLEHDGSICADTASGRENGRARRRGVINVLAFLHGRARKAENGRTRRAENVGAGIGATGRRRIGPRRKHAACCKEEKRRN